MEKEILQKCIEQGLSTWGIAKKLNTNQTKVRKWLKHYKLVTKRITNKNSPLKQCPRCKENKEPSHYYHSTKSSSFCKNCILLSNKERRKETKQLAIEYKGGKCSKCGYNKCAAALEFHHINPEEKDKDYFNQKGGFTEALKRELDKCILICANCHRELHSKLKNYHSD